MDDTTHDTEGQDFVLGASDDPEYWARLKAARRDFTDQRRRLDLEVLELQAKREHINRAIRQIDAEFQRETVEAADWYMQHERGKQ